MTQTNGNSDNGMVLAAVVLYIDDLLLISCPMPDLETKTKL